MSGDVSGMEACTELPRKLVLQGHQNQRSPRSRDRTFITDKQQLENVLGPANIDWFHDLTTQRQAEKPCSTPTAGTQSCRTPIAGIQSCSTPTAGSQSCRTPITGIQSMFDSPSPARTISQMLVNDLKVGSSPAGRLDTPDIDVGFLYEQYRTPDGTADWSRPILGQSPSPAVKLQALSHPCSSRLLRLMNTSDSMMSWTNSMATPTRENTSYTGSLNESIPLVSQKKDPSRVLFSPGPKLDCTDDSLQFLDSTAEESQSDGEDQAVGEDLTVRKHQVHIEGQSLNSRLPNIGDKQPVKHSMLVKHVYTKPENSDASVNIPCKVRRIDTVNDSGQQTVDRKDATILEEHTRLNLKNQQQSIEMDYNSGSINGAKHEIVIDSGCAMEELVSTSTSTDVLVPVDRTDSVVNNDIVRSPTFSQKQKQYSKKSSLSPSLLLKHKKVSLQKSSPKLKRVNNKIFERSVNTIEDALSDFFDPPSGAVGRRRKAPRRKRKSTDLDIGDVNEFDISDLQSSTPYDARCSTPINKTSLHSILLSEPRTRVSSCKRVRFNDSDKGNTGTSEHENRLNDSDKVKAGTSERENRFIDSDKGIAGKSEHENRLNDSDKRKAGKSEHENRLNDSDTGKAGKSEHENHSILKRKEHSSENKKQFKSVKFDEVVVTYKGDDSSWCADQSIDAAAVDKALDSMENVRYEESRLKGEQCVKICESKEISKEVTSDMDIMLKKEVDGNSSTAHSYVDSAKPDNNEDNIAVGEEITINREITIDKQAFATGINNKEANDVHDEKKPADREEMFSQVSPSALYEMCDAANVLDVPSDSCSVSERTTGKNKLDSGIVPPKSGPKKLFLYPTSSQITNACHKKVFEYNVNSEQQNTRQTLLKAVSSNDVVTPTAAGHKTTGTENLNDKKLIRDGNNKGLINTQVLSRPACKPAKALTAVSMETATDCVAEQRNKEIEASSGFQCASGRTIHMSEGSLNKAASLLNEGITSAETGSNHLVQHDSDLPSKSLQETNALNPSMKCTKDMKQASKMLSKEVSEGVDTVNERERLEADDDFSEWCEDFDDPTDDMLSLDVEDGSDVRPVDIKPDIKAGQDIDVSGATGDIHAEEKNSDGCEKNLGTARAQLENNQMRGPVLEKKCDVAVFGGFQTASGSKVHLGKSSLQKANTLFADEDFMKLATPESDDELKIIGANPTQLNDNFLCEKRLGGLAKLSLKKSGVKHSLSKCKTVRCQTSSKQVRQDSSEMKDPALIETCVWSDNSNIPASTFSSAVENLNSSDFNMKDNSSKQFIGFATASGKALKLGDDALKKAEKIFEQVETARVLNEDTISNKTVKDEQTTSMPISNSELNTMGRPRIVQQNISNASGVEDSSLQGKETMFKGFVTGGGKEIKISKSSLSKASSILNDGIESNDSEIKESDTIVNKRQSNVHQKRSLVNTSKLNIAEQLKHEFKCALTGDGKETMLKGFVTGGGREIKISKSALSKASSMLNDGTESKDSEIKAKVELPNQRQNIEHTLPNINTGKLNIAEQLKHEFEYALNGDGGETLGDELDALKSFKEKHAVENKSTERAQPVVQLKSRSSTSRFPPGADVPKGFRPFKPLKIKKTTNGNTIKYPESKVKDWGSETVTQHKKPDTRNTSVDTHKTMKKIVPPSLQISENDSGNGEIMGLPADSKDHVTLDNGYQGLLSQMFTDDTEPPDFQFVDSRMSDQDQIKIETKKFPTTTVKQEDIKPRDFQFMHCRNSDQYQIKTKTKKLTTTKLEDISEKRSIEQVPEYAGFATASGKKMNISEHSLSHARKMFTEDNECGTDKNSACLHERASTSGTNASLASGKVMAQTEVQETSSIKLANLQNVGCGDNSECKRVPSSLSKTADAVRQRELLGDAVVPECPAKDCSDSDHNSAISYQHTVGTNNWCANSFQTANGKNVIVSDKSLKEAKRKFVEDSNVPVVAPGSASYDIPTRMYPGGDNVAIPDHVAVHHSVEKGLLNKCAPITTLSAGTPVDDIERVEELSNVESDINEERSSVQAVIGNTIDFKEKASKVDKEIPERESECLNEKSLNKIGKGYDQRISEKPLSIGRNIRYDSVTREPEMSVVSFQTASGRKIDIPGSALKSAEKVLDQGLSDVTDNVVGNMSGDPVEDSGIPHNDRSDSTDIAINSLKVNSAKMPLNQTKSEKDLLSSSKKINVELFDWNMMTDSNVMEVCENEMSIEKVDTKVFGAFDGQSDASKNEQSEIHENLQDKSQVLSSNGIDESNNFMKESTFVDKIHGNSSGKQFLFQTASGKDVDISEQSLKQAKSLLDTSGCLSDSLTLHTNCRKDGDSSVDEVEESVDSKKAVAAFKNTSVKCVDASEKLINSATAKSEFPECSDGTRPINMFQTASGRNVNVSEKALAHAKADFVKQDILHEDKSRNMFQTASGRNVNVSEKALMHAKADFAKQDILHEDKSRNMFQTASGRNVNVSEKALMHAKADFAKQDILHEDKSRNMFQTASGRNVNVSEKALMHAKADFAKQDIQHEEKSRNLFQTASGRNVNVSEKALAHAKADFVKQDILHEDKSRNMFQTASGRNVNVSEKALAHAKADFTKHDILQEDNSRNMFQTASGQNISVSENALKLIQSKFAMQDEIDDGIPVSVFEKASGKGVNVTEKALDKAKALFEVEANTKEMSISCLDTISGKDSSFEKELRSVIDKNKTKPDEKSFGLFETASGKSVKVCKKALKHAKSLFDIEDEGKDGNLYNTIEGDVSVKESKVPMNKFTANIGVHDSSGEKTFSSLFQTAGGKGIDVSTTALMHARQNLHSADVEQKSGEEVGLESDDLGIDVLDDGVKSKSKHFNKDSTNQPMLMDVNMNRMNQKTKLDLRNKQHVLSRGTEQFSEFASMQVQREDTQRDIKEGNVVKELAGEESEKTQRRQSMRSVPEGTLTDRRPSGFRPFIPVRSSHLLKVATRLDDIVGPRQPEAISHNSKSSFHTPYKTTPNKQQDQHQATATKNVTVKGPVFRANVKVNQNTDIAGLSVTSGVSGKKPATTSTPISMARGSSSNKHAPILTPISMVKDSTGNKHAATLTSNLSGNNLDSLIGQTGCSNTDDTAAESIQDVVDAVDSGRITENDVNCNAEQDRGQGAEEKGQGSNCGKVNAVSLTTESSENDVFSQEEADLFYCNLVEARNKQREIIEEKGVCQVRPITGRLYQLKLTEHRWTLKDVVDWKQCSDRVVSVRSATASEFSFNLSDHYSLHTAHVLVGDGAYLVPDDAGRAGVSEFYRAFLTLDGVDPRLISQAWIKNHYRWITWKLAAYEVSASCLSGRCLSPEMMMLQLKYRYDREIDLAQRSAVRKIYERDDTPSKRLVLCVAAVNFVNIDPKSGEPVQASSKLDSKVLLELTDGWYSIQAQLDIPLSDLVRTGTICVGQKLCVTGAELVGGENACPPLEAPASLMLRISYNSTRPAPWHSLLGYHSDPRPLCVPLTGLHGEGGAVGVTDVIIIRKYPILYMEKLAGGGTVFRTRRSEEKIQREYESRRQGFLERCYSEVEAQLALEEQQEQQSSKREKKRWTSSEVDNLQSGAEIHEALESTRHPDSVQAYLSERQMNMLYEYQLQIQAEKQQRLSSRVQEVLQEKESLAERNVTPMLKFRVAGCANKDLDNKTSTLLTVWRPAEEICELQEGNRYRLYSLNTSTSRSKHTGHEAQLTATKQTRFKQLPVDENFLDNVYEPREVLWVNDIRRRQPAYGEFDFVGIVIRVTRAADGDGVGRGDVVYLGDCQTNILAVRFWNGVMSFGEDLFEEGNMLSCSNLLDKSTFRGQMIPHVEALTEFTHLSIHPHTAAHRRAIERLNTAAKVKQTFLKQAQSKLDAQLQRKFQKPPLIVPTKDIHSMEQEYDGGHVRHMAEDGSLSTCQSGDSDMVPALHEEPESCGQDQNSTDTHSESTVEEDIKNVEPDYDDCDDDNDDSNDDDDDDDNDSDNNDDDDDVDGCENDNDDDDDDDVDDCENDNDDGGDDDKGDVEDEGQESLKTSERDEDKTSVPLDSHMPMAERNLGHNKMDSCTKADNTLCVSGTCKSTTSSSLHTPVSDKIKSGRVRPKTNSKEDVMEILDTDRDLGCLPSTPVSSLSSAKKSIYQSKMARLSAYEPSSSLSPISTPMSRGVSRGFKPPAFKK